MKTKQHQWTFLWMNYAENLMTRCLFYTQHTTSPKLLAVTQDAFILAIQTQWQKEVFTKHVSNIPCMDSTHDMNTYQFEVISCMHCTWWAWKRWETINWSLHITSQVKLIFCQADTDDTYSQSINTSDCWFNYWANNFLFRTTGCMVNHKFRNSVGDWAHPSQSLNCSHLPQPLLPSWEMMVCWPIHKHVVNDHWCILIL